MSVYYATKEQVAAKLFSIFQAVSQLKFVDRQYIEPGNYAYPGLFINDVREARDSRLKDVVLVTWSVLLVLYVYDDSATLSTTLNAEIKRLIDALKADVTLGGLTYNARVLQVDTDEGFLRPHGVALLTTELVLLSQS